MRDQEFTLAEAIAIQDDHLAKWKILLNDKVYQELYKAVKDSNDGVTDPYKVTRGQDLTSWLLNYKHDYKPF